MVTRQRTPREGGIDTQAVRAGQVRSHEGEHNDPIFASSSFVFSSARQAAARFQDQEPGNIYSRFTNPTVRAFEERLSAMEGARYGVATASGMARLSSLPLLRASMIGAKSVPALANSQSTPLDFKRQR